MSAFSEWAKTTRRVLSVRSSQGGDARRLWDEGATYLTKRAAANKMDKPGGDVEYLTDAVRHASRRFEKTIHGEWHQDDGSSGSTGDTVKEADTRATIAGRKNKFDEYSTANRRGVNVAMVNPNKGKKHSILTQKKKGGR